MSVSLSGVIPVRNVQATVEPALLSLLEILAELTRPVELLVVDDGSTDATLEVLSELPLQYPQIKVLHIGQSKGWAEALRTGLAASTGQMVFFEEPGCLLPWEHLTRLWPAVTKHPVVIGRPAATAREPIWPPGPDLPAQSWAVGATYQLVRRSLLLGIASKLKEGVSFRQLLLEEGIGWQEQIIAARPRRAQELLYPVWGQREPLPARSDRAQQQASPPPNYLLRFTEERVPQLFPQ